MEAAVEKDAGGLSPVSAADVPTAIGATGAIAAAGPPSAAAASAPSALGAADGGGAPAVAAAAPAAAEPTPLASLAWRASLVCVLALLFLASEEDAASGAMLAAAGWRGLHGGGAGAGAGASGAGAAAAAGGRRSDCLFFAAGAAYRAKPRAGQSSIGALEAAPLQDLAVASQLAFLQELEERHGHRCDISVSTFSGSPELDERLRASYAATGLTLRRFEVTPRQVSLNDMFLSAFSTVLQGGVAFGRPSLLANDSTAQGYRFAVYMRVDVLLRPFFSVVFDPGWRQTRFSSIEWFDPPGGWDRTAVGSYVWNTTNPRIADMLMFVPRELFTTVPLGGIAHEAWNNLLVRGVPRSAGDVMLRTYHDADTAKDWNPLYELANRPEYDVWHNAGFFWPEGGDFLKPVFDAALQDRGAFTGGAYHAVVERAASDLQLAKSGGADANAVADGGIGSSAETQPRALGEGRRLQTAGSVAAGAGSPTASERPRGRGPLERLHSDLMRLSSESLAAFCRRADLSELLSRAEALGGYGLAPRDFPFFARGARK